jgi:hypothetical protein
VWKSLDKGWGEVSCGLKCFEISVVLKGVILGRFDELELCLSGLSGSSWALCSICTGVRDTFDVKRKHYLEMSKLRTPSGLQTNTP